jgi:deoxyribodipyrimidine photolyase-related protein
MTSKKTSKMIASKKNKENSANTLRLVLGDQLNPLHSWFTEVEENVIYVLLELRQETDYVLHHAQKILAIFAGMRDFAAQLQAAGHRVHYVSIDDATNLSSITDNLNVLISQYQASAFEYQAPDEWRLDIQLADFAKSLSISTQMVDTEHFFTTRDETALLFGDRKKWLMETFYRQMRVKHNVLIEADSEGSKSPKPVGDQWNFDAENRKAWPGLPVAPADIRTLNRKIYDHSRLWATITKAGVKSFGEPNADRFGWPLNRAEALAQLDFFIDQVLPNFGDFEDAMSSKSWRLFHSLLSFSMNVKMLNPREVVAKAEAAGRSGAAPLAAAEGFIRQILGWREFVRGFYWAKMAESAGVNPDLSYTDSNYLNHQLPLPSWFWTGQTQMRCMAAAIGQSLEHAYAHHIQRLMVIGNFALLAGLNPKELHHWYLGIYIDAFEWVELPNTVGMSQFADGGLLATKPYVSSAAYIDRMSDYCKGCHYDKKLREDAPNGKKACPFNALYWDFHVKHADKLAKNPRIGMVYQQLKKMDAGKIKALQAQASALRAGLNSL